MTDIPEDIETKAGRLVDEWSNGQSGFSDLQEAIARAILAERERCAKIARELLVFADTTSEADRVIPAAILSPLGAAYARQSAAAIRSPERAGE
jgi:hypothetical protein